MPESVQSCFELSIHFPVFFSREIFLVAVHGWFALQTNVWKVHSKFKEIYCLVPQLYFLPHFVS